MKVYFSCATTDILKHEKNYRLILTAIEKNGNQLTRNWIDKAIKEANSTKKSTTGKDLYPQVVKAILNADLVIFETTVPSINVGYQIQFALDNKKDVLILTEKDGESINTNFLKNANPSLLRIMNYTDSTLESTLTKFFNEFQKTKSIRYHLLISKPFDSYIRWKSLNTNKTKTDVIEEAISKMISLDEEYKQNN